MSLFHTPRDRIRSSNSTKCTQSSADTEIADNEKFECDICVSEYDSETELHLHRKAKHKLEIYKLLADERTCQICITKQENSDELMKHMKTMHFLSSEDADYIEREIFVCDVCHLVYFNKQMLILHLMYSHNREMKQKGRANCPKCNKNIRVKQAWFHFHRHMIHSLSCCPLCLKKCKNRKDLNEHLKEHPPFNHCNLCQYEAKTLESFKSHMKSHKKGYISFADSLVDRCFIPRHYVRRSIYNFGLNGLQIYNYTMCILCRAICTIDSAPDHVRLHLVGNTTTKKEHACVCGEKFFNNVMLKHHVFKFKGEHAPDTSETVNLNTVTKVPVQIVQEDSVIRMTTVSIKTEYLNV